MNPRSARLLRDRDGIEKVVIDVAEFQALVDAASESVHALPDVKEMIRELKRVFESGDAYVEVDEFLAQYDAAHHTR